MSSSKGTSWKGLTWSQIRQLAEIGIEIPERQLPTSKKKKKIDKEPVEDPKAVRNRKTKSLTNTPIAKNR